MTNFCKLVVPHLKNTCNIFALLSTDEDDDNIEETTIINNRTPKTMEKAYSTLLTNIINKEAISDAGATGNFVLTGTPVNNLQIEIKPISINHPYGSKIRSTHMCDSDIDGTPEKAKLAHIVPGLAHLSLISISVL